ILGLVMAGEIERAGVRVERFRARDRVYAMTKLRFGAYAQYACIEETATLARSPSNLTHEQAAALPYGGLLALHFIEKAGLRSGQSVLVYGASGAIGTAAIQIARIYGARGSPSGRRREGSGRSSTGATRWNRSSMPTGTSSSATRRATSSSLSRMPFPEA